MFLPCHKQPLQHIAGGVVVSTGREMQLWPCRGACRHVVGHSQQESSFLASSHWGCANAFQRAFHYCYAAYKHLNLNSFIDALRQNDLSTA